MKSKKNLLLTSLIYIILFGLYNLLVFVIFKELNDVFWISYAFMCVAFAAQIISLRFIMKNQNIEAVFFGIPLLQLSFYYILAELFVSVIFMIFSGTGIVIPVVIQALLLGIYAIVAIISIMARDTVRDVDSKIKEKVGFIQSIKVDIELAAERATDPELRTRLKKLAETVRYSDPMSNEIVAPVEQMIMQKMLELRVAADQQNLAEAKKVCSDIEMLFIERNKKVMISK